MSTRQCLMIGAIALLACAASAPAATLRVPGDFLTIAEACDASASGDTVLVGPGTWNESVENSVWESLCFPRAGTVLISESGPGATRLVPTSTGTAVTVLEQDDLVSIQGFTIVVERGGGVRVRQSTLVEIVDCIFIEESPALPGIAVMDTGNMIRIVGCRFEGLTGSEAISGGSWCLSACDGTVIHDCEFVSNRTDEILYISGSAPLTVSDCVFRDNESRIIGLELTGNDFPAAVFEDNLFENNVAHSSGFTPAFNVTTTRMRFERNVFIANEWDRLLGSWGLRIIWMRENIFWKNKTTSSAIDMRYTQLRLIRNAFVEHEGGILNSRDGSIYNFDQNIFAYSPSGGWLNSDIRAQENHCNLFWRNVENPFLNWERGLTDVFADPEFCGRAHGRFEVSSASPCLPENNVCAEWIGPLAAGCRPTSIQSRTWAQIKAAYRN